MCNQNRKCRILEPRTWYTPGQIVVGSHPRGPDCLDRKRFKAEARAQGYILDESLPCQPDENIAEWSVGEAERKALTLYSSMEGYL